MHGRSSVRALALRMAIGVVGVVFLVPAAGAQVTLTPFVGSFYSAAKLVDVGNGLVTADQSNTAVYGARLTIPVGATFGVEGAFGFVSSSVLLLIPNACQAQDSTVFDCSTSFKGNVLMGSARLQFRPRRSNLRFNIGGSMVKHSGKDAWSGLTELTDFGAVVGIELRASITPQLPLSLAAEGTFYSFDPDGSASLFPKKTQADLLFTVGIPINLTH